MIKTFTNILNYPQKVDLIQINLFQVYEKQFIININKINNIVKSDKLTKLLFNQII